MYDFKAIYEARSIADALALRAEHPQALILAGGSDILIKAREGKLAGCEVISIFKLDELRGACMADDGAIRIGALTSFSHVAKDALVLKHIPVLAEAVLQVGGPQLRNIGTLGGNVCNGVTSADSASTLMALDATLVLVSQAGERRVPIASFYRGPGKVDIQPGELLAHIEVSRESYERCYGKYIKYSMRAAMDIATLGVSVNCRLTPDNSRFERVRIGLGVAAATPIRCPKAETLLTGKPLDSALLPEFGRAVIGEINPRTSWRASREFRLQLADELSQRALKETVARAGAAFKEEA